MGNRLLKMSMARLTPAPARRNVLEVSRPDAPGSRQPIPGIRQKAGRQMAPNNRGAMAQALAAVPLTVVPPAGDVKIETLTVDAVNTEDVPTTGQTVGAPGHARVQEIGSTNKVANLIAQIMGEPIFSMGDGAVYPDKSITGKSATRLGNVAFLAGGAVKITATIYKDEIPVAGSQKPMRRLRLASPRNGWAINKDNATVAQLENPWRKSITDAFATWLKAGGHKTSVVAEDSTTEVDF